MDHKLYLTDPGIYKKGEKWYHKNGTLVTDTTRLSKFRVPPAWKDVWYASKPKCHIQVYGTDSSGKKQYILSESWINNSRFEKYSRMKSFIKDISRFKKKIKNNNFVVNLLFNLLIDTHIRVGNEIYARKNKTYGLTTLRRKHLILLNGRYHFSFVGKSNINHSIEIPEKYWMYLNKTGGNKLLFTHTDGSEVSSEELNDYLKLNMGEYTCKDFRTYSANVLFIKSFLKNSKLGNKPKKIVLQSIDSTASQLGHSRSISRKSYISSGVIDYCLDSFEKASNLDLSELLEKCS